MPYVVNGQTVSEEAIRQEIELLSRDPQWARIQDVAEREARTTQLTGSNGTVDSACSTPSCGAYTDEV